MKGPTVQHPLLLLRGVSHYQHQYSCKCIGRNFMSLVPPFVLPHPFHGAVKKLHDIIHCLGWGPGQHSSFRLRWEQKRNPQDKHISSSPIPPTGPRSIPPSIGGALLCTSILTKATCPAPTCDTLTHTHTPPCGCGCTELLPFVKPSVYVSERDCVGECQLRQESLH